MCIAAIVFVVFVHEMFTDLAAVPVCFIDML